MPAQFQILGADLSRLDRFPGRIDATLGSPPSFTRPIVLDHGSSTGACRFPRFVETQGEHSPGHFEIMGSRLQCPDLENHLLGLFPRQNQIPRWRVDPVYRANTAIDLLDHMLHADDTEAAVVSHHARDLWAPHVKWFAIASLEQSHLATVPPAILRLDPSVPDHLGFDIFTVTAVHQIGRRCPCRHDRIAGRGRLLVGILARFVIVFVMKPTERMPHLVIDQPQGTLGQTRHSPATGCNSRGIVSDHHRLSILTRFPQPGEDREHLAAIGSEYVVSNGATDSRVLDDLPRFPRNTHLLRLEVKGIHVEVLFVLPVRIDGQQQLLAGSGMVEKHLLLLIIDLVSISQDEEIDSIGRGTTFSQRNHRQVWILEQSARLGGLLGIV